MDRRQIAEEVLAAVGGRENVTANDICMTRLRILTEDPSLVDTEQLSAARGVLGFVKRGENGIEVVFGPGKVEAVHEALVQLTGVEADGGQMVDVYTIGGVKVRTAEASTALDGLAKGVYIVAGKKYVVR